MENSIGELLYFLYGKGNIPYKTLEELASEKKIKLEKLIEEYIYKYYEDYRPVYRIQKKHYPCNQCIGEIQEDNQGGIEEGFKRMSI